MAGLIRSLFKSKKSKKEEEPATDIIFQPCTQRQPTARFADDCQLPSATAAYHTVGVPKRRKGPQSCPGGYQEDSEEEPRGFLKKKSSIRRKDLLRHASRQDFMIDVEREREPQYHNNGQKRYHRSRPELRGHSQFDLRALSADEYHHETESDENHMETMERRSQFYLQKWEDSERQRKEEKRKQDQLEKERNSMQNAMSMAYCMASVQQLEQLKKERDQYKKEMSRYKSKCEKLESKLETAATMSPSFPSFPQPLNPMFSFPQPSPYHTPQYPAPMSFQFSNHHHQQPPPIGPLSSQHPPPSFLNLPVQIPPLHRSTNFMNTAASSRSSGNSQRGPSSFALSNTSTTISDGGAGESLVNPADVSFLRNQFLKAPSNILSGPIATSTLKASDRQAFNFYEDDEDEVKNFRVEQPLPTPSPYSEMTQSSDGDVV